VRQGGAPELDQATARCIRTRAAAGDEGRGVACLLSGAAWLRVKNRGTPGGPPDVRASVVLASAQNVGTVTAISVGPSQKSRRSASFSMLVLPEQPEAHRDDEQEGADHDEPHDGRRKARGREIHRLVTQRAGVAGGEWYAGGALEVDPAGSGDAAPIIV